MQNTDTSPKTKREFRSLSDIVAYKQQLREKIDKDEETIASKWNDLFHKEEEEPRNRAQKLARMVSLGTGVFDGALLGWKLYRFPLRKLRKEKEAQITTPHPKDTYDCKHLTFYHLSVISQAYAFGHSL